MAEMVKKSKNERRKAAKTIPQEKTCENSVVPIDLEEKEEKVVGNSA